LFVWFQFARIAWSWVHAADKAASTRRFGRIEKSSFALITLTFSVCFPS
jgi:hypothetical protein